MHSRRWKWYVNMWGVSSVVVGLPPLARRHAMINAVAMLSNGNVNSLSRAIEPLVNKRRRRCRRFPRLPRPHHPPPPDKTATIANAADQGNKWLMTNVYSSFPTSTGQPLFGQHSLRMGCLHPVHTSRRLLHEEHLHVRNRPGMHPRGRRRVRQRVRLQVPSGAEQE